MQKLIFFDCDGVLVDSEVMSAMITIEILAEYEVRINENEAIEVFSGKNLQTSASIVSETYGVTLPSTYPADHEARLLKYFKSELKAMEGVADLLGKIQTPICVTSNSGHSRLAVALGETNLIQFFGKNVFSSDDVVNGKPAPDLFHFAAKAFGRTPTECVTIDDSILGIQGAVSAGARAIGFSGGSHFKTGYETELLAAGAEVVVSSMRELARFLVEV